MEDLNNFIGALNGILFSNYTVYALLATGVLFTVWSGFGQFRALTHGVDVVRGKYDDKNDPGAINHFQALSAALSATVGLGNIAGVAVAVALGGPGAVLWMWLIGILGMALKMTEVTQSMLFRNTHDPENPHGGPMFVVKKGFKEWGLAPIGTLIGGIFVITLLISAITGGNMFQAWNVADITHTYTGFPQVVTGLILATVVGLVIIGGIKRIGAVAGRIVPFMCAIYMLAALYVLVLNIGEIPSMLLLIVRSGLPDFLGGQSPDATGAFLGGTFGYAALWGIKRALFSSEAGQGSSPIAHSAAKTDEPVREGVVAGLEPFIDTIVVCTLTALVILSSGAFDREAEANFAGASPEVLFVSEAAGEMPGSLAGASGDNGWAPAEAEPPARTPTVSERKSMEDNGEPAPQWEAGESVFAYATLQPDSRRVVVTGAIKSRDGQLRVVFDPVNAGEGEPAITAMTLDTTLYHGALPAWKLGETDLPNMTADARRIRRAAEGAAGWRANENIFVVVEADPDANTGRDLRKLTGSVGRTPQLATVEPLEPTPAGSFTSAGPPQTLDGSRDMGSFTAAQEMLDATVAIVLTPNPDVTAGVARFGTPFGEAIATRTEDGFAFTLPDGLSEQPGPAQGQMRIVATGDDWPTRWTVEWNALESAIKPTYRPLAAGGDDLGIYSNYAGASMTAYAFDRVTPGLGMILVTVAAWLFAVSTMISWSYYGEQGVYYFFGSHGEAITKPAVLIYKIIYCLLILVTTVLAMPIFGENGKQAIIGTDVELDMWTTLGLGVMLVANIPIMLIFGAKAMKAYHGYFKRMDAGEDKPHEAPPITDVVEGKDIE